MRDFVHIILAEKIIGRKLSPKELYLLLLSHNSANGEIGRDGIKMACIGNYTSSQIRQKFFILRQGFSFQDTAAFLRTGVCGHLPKINNVNDRMITPVLWQKTHFDVSQLTN